VLLLVVVGSAVGQDTPDEQACPFCASVLTSVPDFCGSCGRLVLDPRDPGKRSWIDAVFVVEYPFTEDEPTMDLQLDDDGVFVESVRFLSGDRYEASSSGSDREIVGTVHAFGTHKEVKYQATIDERRDDSGRIVRREVSGVVKSKPPRHLYRTLDYYYDEAGRLDKIESMTWHYRKAGDRKKVPSTWLHHDRAEIRAGYEEGRLVRMEGSVREADRDLRGGVFFEEPVTFVEHLAGDTVSEVSFAEPP
jgi:hypothetical protein